MGIGSSVVVSSQDPARVILQAWRRYQAKMCLRVIRNNRSKFERLGGMELYFLDERSLPWDWGLLHDIEMV